MARTTSRFTGLLAALGLCALASGTASAAIIDFSFQNEGWIDNAQSCGANCLRVTTVGHAVETGGLSGANSWAFTGVMEFSSAGWFGVDGDGTGTGLGWSFLDTSGVNNLYGSFSSSLSGLLVLGGVVDYVINGGTGLFSGATGTGQSFLSLSLLGQFKEKGWMQAVTPNGSPSVVPEPGVVSLMAAGFAMFGAIAWRRRRATPQH